MEPSCSTSSAANRRSSMRKSPKRSVRLECRKGALGLGPNIAAGFLDISEGGMRLIVNALVKKGDEAEVILSGYGVGAAIKRLATICWVVPLEGGRYCIGLRFQKIVPFREVQALATP